MSFDKTKHFARARTLLEFLLSDELAPDGYLRASERGRNGFIFRGHADANWGLTPSVQRPTATGNHRLSDFTPQAPGREFLERGERRRHLGIHVHAEIRSVLLFLQKADNLGIPTPLDYGALRHHRRLLEQLMREDAVDYTEPFPHPDLIDGFALAQHHGVPTRLLDWTESPLVAAYFAAEMASSALGQTAPSKRIAVICLNTEWLSYTADVAMVEAPRHSNTFMRVQQGVFTYHPSANAYYVEHQRWPCIEEFREADRRRGSMMDRFPLVRLTLPATQADELLRLLWRYDVTRHHLRPTLDNAARAFAYLKALWPTATGQ